MSAKKKPAVTVRGLSRLLSKTDDILPKHVLQSPDYFVELARAVVRYLETHEVRP